MAEARRSDTREIDWGKLIEEALNAPGNMGTTYERFYSYSFLNQIYLLSQGIKEPVATRQRWRDIGRTVLKGSLPKEIIRPVLVEQKQEDGTVMERLVGFKPVKCIFTLSETEGAELPPAPLPEWDEAVALRNLRIRRIGFTALNGNIQGFSRNRDVALNPIALNPRKTLIHEAAHIVLGHTAPQAYEEYAMHRGIKEFEAEATTYLTMNELGQLDEATATVSRGYIRHWLDDAQPPDHAIRRVFSATNQILKAGRIVVSNVIEGTAS